MCSRRDLPSRWGCLHVPQTQAEEEESRGRSYRGEDRGNDAITRAGGIRGAWEQDFQSTASLDPRYGDGSGNCARDWRNVGHAGITCHYCKA